MYFNLVIVLLGVTYTRVSAAPTEKAPSHQLEKRALTFADALAGCYVPSADISLFWTNSKTSEHAQSIAEEYADAHDLITMDEACESVLETAASHDMNTISEAFAQATINAGSKIAYVILPNAGAGPKSMWIQQELPILKKAKLMLHKMSLENPNKAPTIEKLS